jgi:hypothetical protein
MQLRTPFDPIAPGEWDNFAFNFGEDLAGASIVATTWVCTLRPLQTVVDAAPQAHVASAFAQSQLVIDEGALAFPMPPNVPVTIYGAFSVARVGGFLPSQAGATYRLAATVVTSDGRTLSLSADLPVGLP